MTCLLLLSVMSLWISLFLDMFVSRRGAKFHAEAQSFSQRRKVSRRGAKFHAEALSFCATSRIPLRLCDFFTFSAPLRETFLRETFLRETFFARNIFFNESYYLPSACLKSLMISSMCSIPTETLSRFGTTPLASCSSSVSC